MKISYIILENFSNIDTAMNANKIKLDFRKAKNKIILLVGPNGSGKTSVLSLLTPFATVGGLDVRNSSNLIIDGKNGYKEIEIVNKENVYLIKHYYTPKKDGGHSVKSYIEKDGSELNPNGNVTSFKEWVKEELYVELDYLKLIRLGSNVTSMIDLSETERKTFMNKLLENADIFLAFFKKVSNDLKQLKELTSHAIDKQNRLGIKSTDDVKESIKNFQQQLDFKRKEYDRISGNISISRHVIDEIEDSLTLKSRLNDTEKRLNKMRRILEKKDYSISETPEFYLSEITRLEKDIIQKETKISASNVLIQTYLSRLDELNESKHNLEVQYHKEKENDVELQSMELEIKKIILDSENIKKRLNEPKPNISKSELDNFVVFLKNSQQQISRTYEFGKNPVKRVILLLKKEKNVMQYINSHLYNIQSSSNTDIFLERIRSKFNFSENNIPKDCKNVKCVARQAYIQIGNLINLDEDRTNDDISLLQTMELVYHNIIQVLTEFQTYGDLIHRLPENIRKDFLLIILYDNISENKPIYNETKMNQLMTIVTEFHTLDELEIKRDEMETTLHRFKRLSNIEYLENQLFTVEDDIDICEEKISSLKKDISDDTESITNAKYTLEYNHELYETFTQYDALEDEYTKLKTEYDKFLENSSNIKTLSIELSRVSIDIEVLTQKIQNLKTSLVQYKELQKELKTYGKVYDEMTLVKESLSSSKGIPLRYVKSYLGNTEEITNELLDIVYKGDIYIDKFKISQTEFTIPFYNKGKLLRDVKLASQGERNFISIALAFALSSQTMHEYNIMLLDEMDNTLDIKNREKFLRIMENQIDRINAEQAFFITHSNMFSSYPVDVINFGKSSDIDYEGTIEIKKW